MVHATHGKDVIALSRREAGRGRHSLTHSFIILGRRTRDEDEDDDVDFVKVEIHRLRGHRISSVGLMERKC
jgi:hypothetical protein